MNNFVDVFLMHFTTLSSRTDAMPALPWHYLKIPCQVFDTLTKLFALVIAFHHTSDFFSVIIECLIYYAANGNTLSRVSRWITRHESPKLRFKCHINSEERRKYESNEIPIVVIHNNLLNDEIDVASDFKLILMY
jgi:hypothetical protein